MNVVKSHPYIGPRTFLKEEGHLFFGREREARDLLALVVSERLVLFYAQSGAGKSSLINTCLIPRLEDKGFEVLPVARVSGDLPPGHEADNIFAYNLAYSLIQQETAPRVLAGIPSLSEFLSGLDNDETGYFYNDNPPQSAEETHFNHRRTLIIDQFEELFSTHPDAWEKREDFFRQLARAMEDDPYLWVVLVMREDYIAAMDPYAYLLPGGARTRYYMQRLNRESALKAVKEPVESLRPFAEGVAEKLVDDLCSIKVQKPDGTLDSQPGQYVEPVQLQVVCYSLWENLPIGGTQITEKDLQGVGDVNQSLGRYYAARVKSVAELQGVSERSIRQWFGRKLIATSGIRNMVLRETNKQSGGLDDEVIQALQSDLVRAEKRGGATWYELTHDRLVEPILKNNNKWFDEYSSILQRQAELWVQRDRADGSLFTGIELLDAEEWAKQNKDELGELENDFLAACREKEKENRSRERQRNWIIGVSVVVAVVMIVLAGLAWKGRNEAIDAEKVAKAAEAAAKELSIEAQEQAHYARGNELAVNSQAVFGTDNQLGLLLALESLDEAEQSGEYRLPLAEDLLRRTIGKIGIGIPLYGHTTRVSAVAMSPDGHWLASGSDDYTVRLWNMTVSDPSAKPILLSTDSCQTLTLIFSSDSDWLASGCNDATIRLWDMTAQEPSAYFVVLNGHSDYVYSLAFSSNGHWLASGSRDTTVRLWDMTASDPSVNPTVLNGHSGLILTLAFSPDNDWLASGSADTTVRLWDMTATDPSANPTVLGGHSNYVNDLTFSPNGNWLASGSEDATVRLWDMTVQNPSTNPIVLYTDFGAILTLAFSPDGYRLVGGGNDAIVRLWDMTTQDISASRIALTGHSDWIRDLAFTPDGHWLASASDDSNVRLWDMTAPDPSASPIVFKGHSGSVDSLAFSPDNHWLVSAGDDATPRLWDISAQSEILKVEQEISSYEMITSLTGHTKGINALSFSLDGTQLASASEDATIRLWNFQTGLPTETNRTLQSAYGSGSVNTLFFIRGVNDSEGGLIAGTGNNKLLIFDLSEDSLTELSFPLAGHEGAISILAFNRNLGLVAVPSNINYSVELWNGDTSQRPLILTGHKSVIHSIVFSPDNHWLASGGGNATIILWDVEDFAVISPIFLEGQAGDVYAIAFSPNGRWLASASSDSIIRLWDMSKGAPSEATYVLRGHQGAVRSLAFSPAGRWLASAGDDSTIHLWDMSNPSVDPIVLHGNTGSITALTFSPDGRWLVSGGSDSNLQIWGTGMEALKSQACKIANRNLTWQEWREYFKNIPYKKTCAGFPVHPSVAVNLRAEGDQLARSGDDEAAIAKYHEARGIDSKIDLVVYDLSFDFSSIDDINAPEARATILAAQALIDAGDSLAQTGDDEGAVAKYREALTVEPAISSSLGDPESRAKGLVAQALIDAGDSLAQTGDVEGAVVKYREALTVEPAISSSLGDPESRAKGLVAQILISIGDGLVQSGDIEGAVAKYREALAIDPSMSDDLGDPESRAKGLAAQTLISIGDGLVQSGDIEGAVAKYHEALAVDPSVSDDLGDPESRAKGLAAQTLINIGDGLAQTGDIEGAVAKYQDALTFDPTVSDDLGDLDERAMGFAMKEEISSLISAGKYQEAASKFEIAQGIAPNIFTVNDADLLNNLCWDSSLSGYAQDVKDACEMAVALAPDDPYIRDSRGVNRALLGNIAGAIEDFEFAVKWYPDQNAYFVPERKAWITALENGQNPFDDATLQSLK